MQVQVARSASCASEVRHSCALAARQTRTADIKSWAFVGKDRVARPPARTLRVCALMVIDKSTFLYLTSALAVGGGVGYVVARDNLNVRPPPPIERPVALGQAPIAQAPFSAASALPPPVPICDDSVGTPGDCPPVGYSAEEGGCGALPMKRCNEYKRALKPRVAERAVSCINALKPHERCDQTRLSLCGHSALMNACIEPPGPPLEGGGTAPRNIDTTCSTIVHGCEGVAVRPTQSECRASLMGMTSVGRAAMVQCMKTHCADKGLAGCESGM